MTNHFKRMLRQRPGALLPTSSQVNIAAGFAILISLIIMVAWFSVHKMDSNQAQLQFVLDQHIAKLDLITEMRNAARERTIAMQQLILMDDPFEQDEIFLYFNRLGAVFTRARAEYLQMDLDSRERAILDEQGRLTGKNVPYQRQVTDLVVQGKRRQAQQVLVNVAIPGQDEVLHQLDRLHDLQKRAVHVAANRQSNDFQRTRALVIGFVIVIVILAAVVAVVVLLNSRRYEKALFESQEKAVVTLTSIGEAVISIDGSGCIDYINPQAEKLLGKRMHDVKGQPISECMDLYCGDAPVDFAVLVRRRQSEENPEPYIQELALRTRLREYVVELSMAPIHDRAGKVVGQVMAMRDVSAMRALDAEVKFQASHDSLTGLYNRHEFERRTQSLLELARTDDSEHAVCYFDLDMFKVVNDTCGHIAGDELLRQLAVLLQQAIRKTDILARIGGDEFALLLQHCSMSKAKSIAEKFLGIIEGFRFHWENHTFQIGASIGVAPIRSDSGTLVDIMQTADFACYSAKDAGRNRVHTADMDADMVEKRRGHAHWMARMNDALDHDGFEIYFQDIRSLQNGEDGLRRAELLVRMHNENGDLVSPMAFIPAAERYHMMPQIDRWVIGKAINLLASAYNKAGDDRWRISINLSGQSFSDQKFLQYVQQQIDNWGIDPRYLCFEITETSAISNLAGAIRFMTSLRDLGCRFSLDDFGSGLSSFGYLRNLPVDSVKIDGIFIRDLKNDLTHRAIVSSITQIAHAMNIATIAEYVETDEVRRLLVELGVDYGQGFLFGKPQPFSPFEQPAVSGKKLPNR